MKYPKNLEYVKASQDAGDNLDMSTKATDEELNEAITDEFGVKYSLLWRIIRDRDRSNRNININHNLKYLLPTYKCTNLVHKHH